MKSRCRVLVLVSLAGLLISCGGGGGDAGLETPSGAILQLVSAIEAEDVELYLGVLPADARAQTESSREAMGEAYDATIRGTMSSMKGLLEGAEIVREEIDGDTATVLVKNQDGLEITWNCVRESDGWKVAILG